MTRYDFTCDCGFKGKEADLFSLNLHSDDNWTCPKCEQEVTVRMLDYVRERQKEKPNG